MKVNTKGDKQEAEDERKEKQAVKVKLTTMETCRRKWNSCVHILTPRISEARGSVTHSLLSVVTCAIDDWSQFQPIRQI